MLVVLVLNDTANVMSMVLLVSGISTLLQSFFRTCLPLVQGSLHVYLAPALVIVNSEEFCNLTRHKSRYMLRELHGAIMIESLFQSILEFSDLMSLLLKYLKVVTYDNASFQVNQSLKHLVTIGIGMESFYGLLAGIWGTETGSATLTENVPLAASLLCLIWALTVALSLLNLRYTQASEHANSSCFHVHPRILPAALS
ncbi:Nucleobase-ascorbate transporter 11 [Bienertia sinuspersici]